MHAAQNASTDTDYRFKETCVCLWQHISSAAESRVFYFPCAQMSVSSYRLVRQLPGDQQEAVRAHTLSHRLCLDPSCRKHDTFEDAKPTQREYENLWDLVFLLFNITYISCVDCCETANENLFCLTDGDLSYNSMQLEQIKNTLNVCS